MRALLRCTDLYLMNSSICGCAQSCMMLCDPMNYSLPGSSVHGILQARILEWVAISSFRDHTNPGMEPASPALAGGFFTTEPPEKPPDTPRRCLFSQAQVSNEQP